MVNRRSGRASRKTKEAAPAPAAAQPKGRGRKKKPAEEMIGKRISIDYPGDTAEYDGRVIDYLPKKKIHKVYYFVDESIEELSLSSKRKWKIIEEPVPDPDPQGASALLGKLVKLPVNASEQLNPHEPIEDFRAVVLEIVKGGRDDSESEEEGEDDDSPVRAPDGTKKIMHKVVYLANECLTTLNMDNVRYSLIDNVSGEVVSEVNATKDPVRLEMPEEKSADEAPDLSEEEDDVAPKVESDGAPWTASTVQPSVSAGAAAASPATASAGASATPTNTAGRSSTKAGSSGAGNSAGKNRRVLFDEEEDLSSGDGNVPLRPSSKGKSSSSGKKSAGKGVRSFISGLFGMERPSNSTVSPRPSGSGSASRPAQSSTVERPGLMEIEPVATNGDAPSTSYPVRSTAMPASDIGAMAASAAANLGKLKSTVSPELIAPVVPDMDMDIVEPADVVGPNASESAQPASTGSGAGQSSGVNGVSSSDLTKPLTEHNLNMHDAEMNANGSAGAAVAEKDDDVSTLSVGDDVPWGPQAALMTGESLVSSYVKIRQNGQTRNAFVEAYFAEKKTHLVSFSNNGGTMQLRLTKENFRLLSKEETSQLTNWEKEETPVRSNKRKNGTEDKGKGSKRLRQADSVPPKGAGAELIGACITIQWPGDGANFRALVVGFQDNGLGDKKHKVYYISDESTEVLDLSKREWCRERPGTIPWDLKGIVGKRVYVFWDGEYDEAFTEDRRISEERFGVGKTQVPYEAFIVQFIGPFKYKLMYTNEDHIEDRELRMENDEVWDLLETGQKKAKGMTVISWSSN